MSKHTLSKLHRRASRAANHNAEQALTHQPDRQHHRIITRSRALHFPLLRLPAELRNKIYAYALAAERKDPPISLRALKIPPLPQTSRQIRGETLGLLTSVNEISLTIRSTYCVTGRHVASSDWHRFYLDTGFLRLDAQRRAWLLAQGAVFRALEIRVLCCCCEETRIGYFRIRVLKGGKCERSSSVKEVRGSEGLERAFDGIGKAIEGVLSKAEARNGFVGLSVGDLEEIAGCFRWREVVVVD